MNQKIRVLLNTGFFHIFGAGTINKVISALLSFIVVRILSKEDFGIYSYVYNLVSFFILFNGLGATSSLLQLGSEAKSDADIASVLKYATRIGVLFDVLLALSMIALSFFPLNFPESPMLLRLYAFYPLVLLLFDMQLTLFRVKLENKWFALFSNIQTVLLAILSIVGALGWNVVGLIAGQYLAYVLSFIAAVFAGGRALTKFGAKRASSVDKGAYWKLSVTSSINNGLGSALTLVGVFLVGLLTNNEFAVADFKVATTIPFALLFIPGAVVTYIYPYFVRQKENASWSLSRYLQLIMAGIIGYGIIAFVFCIMGKWLIGLVFGVQYENVTPAFQIIMLGFFVTATFRQPTGNLLVTQRKLWFNTFTGVLSLAVCCLLCLWLIPGLGIEGAAWAYTISLIVGACCNVPYYLAVLLKKRRELEKKYQESNSI